MMYCKQLSKEHVKAFNGDCPVKILFQITNLKTNSFKAP